MRVEENRCIGCDLEMCCSEECNYGNLNSYYCDHCNGRAKYRIDGIDLCEECADKYCANILNDFTIEERCELLQLYFERRY